LNSDYYYTVEHDDQYFFIIINVILIDLELTIKLTLFFILTENEQMNVKLIV